MALGRLSKGLDNVSTAGSERGEDNSATDSRVSALRTRRSLESPERKSHWGEETRRWGVLSVGDGKRCGGGGGERGWGGGGERGGGGVGVGGEVCCFDGGGGEVV